jgi:hypothetical protein
VRSSYFHIAVCMLEWQTMEELVGMEHARKVIEWERTDHWASRAGRKYLELARSEVVSGAVRENEAQKIRP